MGYGRRHGLCRLHFYRIYNNKPPHKFCIVDGCNKEIFSGKYCYKHRQVYTWNGRDKENKQIKKLKVWLHHKNITSDGCSAHISKVVDKFKMQNRLFCLYYNYKEEHAENRYKLQVISVPRNEEKWLRFITRKEADKVWKLLTSYMWKWDTLVKI